MSNKTKIYKKRKQLEKSRLHLVEKNLINKLYFFGYMMHKGKVNTIYPK